MSLKYLQDGDSTSSLGSLFQYLMTLFTEDIFPNDRIIWTWHRLHFLKGAKLAKCKQVLFTVMHLFCEKTQAFILCLNIGNCSS